MGAAIGLVGLLMVWRTGRRIGGPLPGLVALILLATCPLYVGHVLINAKDGPFAVAMAVLLLALVRTFEDYPRIAPTTGLLLGVGLGLSIGSRIMGAFGVIAALAALLLAFALDTHTAGLRAATRRLGRFVLAMLPVAVLAYAVMGLVWPWAVVDPLNPIYAVEYFSHFFEKPWHELFGGELVLVPDMPRTYVPTLLALELPEILSLFVVAGAVGTLVTVCRRDLAPNRRAMYLLPAVAALLPIAVTIVARPAMYNGLRHFVFVLPPLAVLAGLAAAWLLQRAWQRSRPAALAMAAMLIAGIALPIAEMVRLHPYEYTYFNSLSGGVRSAREHYMLDYWALSFKQASQALAAKLAERHEVLPSDRRWKLAVCGPHRSPQVELGPDFETTWDPSGADFAMMLGEFYCATFDAPLLAEVVRDGVVYARVYDIRGRNFTSLLTVPEP